MQRRIPRRLRSGDCIGIIAPASPASSTQKIERGIRYLESLGFHVRIGASVNAQLQASDTEGSISHGYLAADDLTRAADINGMFADPEIKAIFCTRGGYGTPRLLTLVDYPLIRRYPKILVGYSDITALHLAIYARTGLVTFQGPMVAVEMRGGMDTLTESRFWGMLMEPRRRWPLYGPSVEPVEVLHAGEAEGILLGGNLSLVTATMGTRFMPDLRGVVLALEEIGEEIYRVDRMFAQLHNAGVLEGAAGLLLGGFTGITSKNWSLTLDEVFRHYSDSARGPVVAGLSFGHRMPKLTLPHGASVRLHAGGRRVTVLGPVVV